MEKPGRTARLAFPEVRYKTDRTSRGPLAQPAGQNEVRSDMVKLRPGSFSSKIALVNCV
jgi:hypothetical protein